MSIVEVVESDLNEGEPLVIDYVVLASGTVLEKLYGSEVDVVVDSDGVGYFQFLWIPPITAGVDDEDRAAALHRRENYPQQLTIRADQVNHSALKDGACGAVALTSS